ncbi:hypothetical protein EV121DRAFT_273209 [Schizophyllum commune]
MRAKSRDSATNACSILDFANEQTLARSNERHIVDLPLTVENQSQHEVDAGYIFISPSSQFTAKQELYRGLYGNSTSSPSRQLYSRFLRPKTRPGSPCPHFGPRVRDRISQCHDVVNNGEPAAHQDAAARFRTHVWPLRSRTYFLASTLSHIRLTSPSRRILVRYQYGAMPAGERSPFVADAAHSFPTQPIRGESSPFVANAAQFVPNAMSQLRGEDSNGDCSVGTGASISMLFDVFLFDGFVRSSSSMACTLQVFDGFSNGPPPFFLDGRIDVWPLTAGATPLLAVAQALQLAVALVTYASSFASTPSRIFCPLRGRLALRQYIFFAD